MALKGRKKKLKKTGWGAKRKLKLENKTNNEKQTKKTNKQKIYTETNVWGKKL